MRRATYSFSAATETRTDFPIFTLASSPLWTRRYAFDLATESSSAHSLTLSSSFSLLAVSVLILDGIMTAIDILNNMLQYIFSMSDALPFSGLLSPQHVSIKKDQLHWRYADDAWRDRGNWRLPADRMLISFAKLADAPPRDICAFALRYCPLGAHRRTTEPKGADRLTCLQFADGSWWSFGLIMSGSGSDPLTLWRTLSAMARSILRINAALKGRAHNRAPHIGAPEDWMVLAGREPEDIFDARRMVMDAVNEWLQIGSVRLLLGLSEWSACGEWKLHVDTNGLVASIAYRLLLTVAGEDNLYACDGCREPYIRTWRAPRPGQENFCANCASIAKKRAVQRYRERRKRDAETRSK